MSIIDSKTLYQFLLQQMAAESYFEGKDLSNTDVIKAQLRLGTNRPGYQDGPSDLNDGYARAQTPHCICVAIRNIAT